MNAEHGDLLQMAETLLGHLASSRGRLLPGEVAYEQHSEFAERAWSLHLHLRGALSLIAAGLYPPAFATLRAALEHHVVDQLLFLGNRYRVVLEDVSDEELTEWAAALREGTAPDLLDVRRQSGRRLEIVRTGVHFEGGPKGPDAPGLSVYYGILEGFDPFTGGREAQDYIGDWSFREDSRQRRVARQGVLWKRSLTWRALIENLDLNDLYSRAELARWHVHYSFLSAFSHPVSERALTSVYGRIRPRAIRHDHYASELGLLYVVTLAYLELEAFDSVCQREPRVELGERDSILTDIAHSRSITSYLWFPKGPPTMFDRVQEANWRGARPEGIVPWSERPKPEDLGDEEVRYYENPLKRVIQMHFGINELTGFQWASPWQRSDAMSRSLDC